MFLTKDLFLTFLGSAKAVHEPITWVDNASSSQQKKAAEQKKVSEILNLNPFECQVLLLLHNFICAVPLIIASLLLVSLVQKNEFLVTVTVKKIDSSWWYNACKKYIKTAKRHGDSYRCTNPKCGAIGVPCQRLVCRCYRSLLI